MSVLVCFDWVISSGSIVTYVFLLMFVFAVFFKLLRY